MSEVIFRNQTAQYIDRTTLMGSIKLDRGVTELRVYQEGGMGKGPVKLTMSYTKTGGQKFLYCAVTAASFDQALAQLKSCNDKKKPLADIPFRNKTHAFIGDTTKQELLDIVSVKKPKEVYVSSDLGESYQLTLTYKDSRDQLVNLCTGHAKRGKSTSDTEAFENLKRNCKTAVAK